eukprot:scaffold22036_cov133-Skeletonema_dohrnii-CCMP3373.AAC.2
MAGEIGNRNRNLCTSPPLLQVSGTMADGSRQPSRWLIGRLSQLLFYTLRRRDSNFFFSS